MILISSCAADGGNGNVSLYLLTPPLPSPLSTLRLSDFFYHAIGMQWNLTSVWQEQNAVLVPHYLAAMGINILVICNTN
jgi:hypothetical protein